MPYNGFLAKIYRISMYLIFDFDGTIANSFYDVVDKFNLLAQKYHFRQITEDEISSLRDLTSTELIKHLRIPLYKLPAVIFEARKHMREEIHNLRPFEGLPEVLHKLYEQGYILGIVTSNSVENVEMWLAQQNMLHYFAFIHSESNFFGKTRVLKKICRSHKIDKSQAFYIGDETRDIDAARQCQMQSIAATWGLSSEKALMQHNPTYLAHKPEDLLNILQSL